MNKVTIVIVGVLMAICWGLCAGVLTFMKNVNDIADADCIFSHKWICTLTNYTCYVSVVSSFCTMGFLYYLWRRMAAADGKSPFTVLFSVLGVLVTILWIVSLAGKAYEWGLAAVDLPWSYSLGNDFGTLYAYAKALLITTHFCILIWVRSYLQIQKETYELFLFSDLHHHYNFRKRRIALQNLCHRG
eukprot:m.187456 g.187456  ORF g.187456 m.187456 type:complete len:188 (+) comp39363_c0_seq12:173-736(+)